MAKTRTGTAAIAILTFATAASYAEDTALMTAPAARAMITGIGIATTAGRFCPGMTLDDDLALKLMGLARDTLGDVADQILAHEVKQAAKDATKYGNGKHDWCEMVKSSPGYNMLMTITE